MSNKDPDQQEQQSKKRKYKRWLKMLRNPKTLRLLIKLGLTTFNLLKWLIEILQD